MAYTTVTDECPFIRFSGNTLEDVVVEKSKVKLELVGTTINVVFISGGAQIISWNEAQALEYGYTPTSLYSYILGILKVQCGGGGGGIDSVQAGTNIIIDNSDPSNPIINATFSQEGKYLISGGAAWSGTGLTYDVTALTYFFNGNKISLATQVTLAVADPTNNRLDAIVVDEAGVVSVIQGTASVNPITPPIPEEQLLVQYILVEAGLASPSVSNENIYLDDPAGSWTLSTYTTGAPTGTLVFNGTTSPKEGINHIQANADQRLGARFVRATSFDAFQYTVLQVWVRFTGTNVDSNKSLNVRFENSVGTLVGNTLNLFNYGIQRNVLNTWQLAVIPITAFGSLPSTVKGFRAIMIGGTVGVTRQWDMDWILLSDSSVPNVEVPKINFYKDDNVVGSQSGLNLKAGTNIGITAVNDVINNRVEYVVDALGGGGGSSFETKTKAEIDTLISTNALVVGTLYKITGFHNSSATLGALENDGVTDGITVFLKAIATNKLQEFGTGVFHSPIRDGSHWNNRIFQTYIKLDGSLTSGSLIVDDTITADNGATGTMRIIDATYVLIDTVSGDWSSATSFTSSGGGVFSVSAYTAPLGSTIGDKVLWGNYVWTNTTGTVGTATDDRTLDANWSKVAYNNTDYVTMYNYCEVNIASNWVTRRVDALGNYVSCPFNFGKPFNSIGVFEWNNIADYGAGLFGTACNNVEFGYVVSCNLWKHSMYDNFIYSGEIYNNKGNIYKIYNNHTSEFRLYNNVGNNYDVGRNVGVKHFVNDNKGSGYTFKQNKGIEYHIDSNIGYGCTISGNELSYEYYVLHIHHNNITSPFTFKNNNGVSCEIDGNSNTFNLSGTIENTIFEAPTVFNVDLSGATVIKSSYSKRVFKRPDSTFKIVHFDNTDTQVINDITD